MQSLEDILCESEGIKSKLVHLSIKGKNVFDKVIPSSENNCNFLAISILIIMAVIGVKLPRWFSISRKSQESKIGSILSISAEACRIMQLASNLVSL